MTIAHIACIQSVDDDLQSRHSPDQTASEILNKLVRDFRRRIDASGTLGGDKNSNLIQCTQSMLQRLRLSMSQFTSFRDASMIYQPLVKQVSEDARPLPHSHTAQVARAVCDGAEAVDFNLVVRCR